MITLDERLSAVIAEIEPCRVIADIGADHGKIAVSARLQNLAEKIIAADISAHSIAKARRLADKCGVELDIRVGNGLSVLTANEYDTVIIAGMGGKEIINILSSAIKKFNRYILAPHSKSYELRKFLSDSGIRPLKDYKVFSNGRFYDVITAEIGAYNPEKDVLYFGYYENNPIFKAFSVKERARLNEIIGSGGVDKSAEMLEILNGIAKDHDGSDNTRVNNDC